MLCTMNRLAVHMLFLSYRVRDRYASMSPIMLQFMLELPKPAMQGIKPNPDSMRKRRLQPRNQAPLDTQTVFPKSVLHSYSSLSSFAHRL